MDLDYPQHLASSAMLTLALLCAPAAARAQDAPPSPPVFPGTPLPPPVFPGTPLGPVLPPAPLQPYPWGSWGPDANPYSLTPPSPPSKRWYGWQILLPTLASDVVGLAGAATSGSTAGAAFLVSGVIGHAISGPIVHLVHHHPLKALASFGLEAALPGAAVLGVVAAAASCNNIDDGCVSAVLLVAILGLPIALTAGPAIDSAALAWEDRPASSDKAPAVTWNVAPLVLPPLRPGAAHVPAPAGVALVGTF